MELTIELVGTTSLLQHNVRLANPFDEYTQGLKGLTGKRKKTETDLLEISRLEWEGGMYYDEEIGPYIPDEWLYKMIVMGARKSKNGKQAESGILISTLKAPIEYTGPRKLQEMWDIGDYTDRRMVTVGQAKVLRTRPIFAEWAVTFSMIIDEATITEPQIVDAVEKAGSLIGIGDYRPRYGRFEGRLLK